jgi:hypothetical protein
MIIRHGRPFRGYNRTRLTPFVKKLFNRWLAWRR